jgi:hypothetical protein
MATSTSNQRPKLNLKAGDWVEVLSKEEILKTLDQDAQLDGMPFMPEMFEFCGKRFQVQARAHKTCDTVFPVRGRRVDRAIHLETRCDGGAHDGCQAGCLIFWKEAWIKPVSGNSPAAELVNIAATTETLRAAGGCTEADVWSSTIVSKPNAPAPVYSCQATRLPYFTTALQWWEISQYIEDYRSRNVGLWRMICGFVYAGYFNLSQSGLGLGPIMRWFYDKAHPLWNGTEFPRKRGTIPAGEPTPTGKLNLQPGELVRVKSYREILKTLNTENKNRGLVWDAELAPFCGGTYRVLKSVTKIVDERTGVMTEMKNPCIILDSVVCKARYSECRMFCPRAIYSYWREIWMDRVNEPAGQAQLETKDEPEKVLQRS